MSVTKVKSRVGHFVILGGNSYRCRLGSKVRAASVILEDRVFHHGVVHDKCEYTDEARWSAIRGGGKELKSGLEVEANE